MREERHKFIIIHEINDGDKCIYDKVYAALAKNAYKYRNADDPNRALMIIHWEGTDLIKIFHEFYELKEALRKAGTPGKPEFYILEKELMGFDGVRHDNLVVLKLENHTKWKTLPDEIAGLVHRRSPVHRYRNINDSRQIIITTDWRDLEGAKNLFGSDKLMDALQQTGAPEQPEISYFEKKIGSF